MGIQKIIDVKLRKTLLILSYSAVACLRIAMIRWIFLAFETKVLIRDILAMMAAAIFLMILPEMCRNVWILMRESWRRVEKWVFFFGWGRYAKMILTIILPSWPITLPLVAGPIVPRLMMRFPMWLFLYLADIWEFLEFFKVAVGQLVLLRLFGERGLKRVGGVKIIVHLDDCIGVEGHAFLVLFRYSPVIHDYN